MADRKSDESNTTSHDDIVAFTAKVHLAGLSISTLGHAVFGFGDKVGSWLLTQRVKSDLLIYESSLLYLLTRPVFLWWTYLRLFFEYHNHD